MTSQQIKDFYAFEPNLTTIARRLMTQRQRQLHDEKCLAYAAEWNLIHKIENKCQSAVEVVERPNVGRTVVATERFQAGDYVAVYGGEIKTVHEKKVEEDAESHGPAYAFFCRDKDGKPFVVDASNEKPETAIGCFINHSGDKRRINVIPGLHPVCPRQLYFTATREIEIGEELRYDYGDRRSHILDDLIWLRSHAGNHSASNNDFVHWKYS